MPQGAGSLRVLVGGEGLPSPPSRTETEEQGARDTPMGPQDGRRDRVASGMAISRALGDSPA